METGPAHKNMTTLGLMALVILAPATVFAFTGDAPQTLILTAAGLTLSALVRRPLERSTRSFVYTGLAAVAVAVISQQAFPVDDKRFFLVPAHVYCPPLLFLAVAITFLDHRDSNVSGVVGLALLAMMMSGNCMDFQVPHRRLPIPGRWETYLHPFYGVAVAVQLAACVPLMARGPFLRIDRVAQRPYRGLRLAVAIALFASAAAVTLGLRLGARHLEYFWQTGFTELVRTRLGRHRGVVFGRDVDLWRTVPHRSAADDAIVLRALAPQAPGYLRGRAYTRYRGGRWTSTGTDLGLPFEQPGGRLTYSIFRRASPSGSGEPRRGDRTDIYPARQFRSDVLLAPGCATAFELIADGLSDSTDGELSPANWERQVGYTVIAPTHDDDSAFGGPADAASRSSDYLDIPDGLREPLHGLAETIFSGPTGDAATAVPDLERFFGRQFRYELGTMADPEAGDPVLQFLTQRRSGHCELFASAAVLLLRAHGVPARYVTGLVCQERLAVGTWAGRLADLHAWTEAFDAAQGRWLLVEVTPAAGLPPGTQRSGFIGRGLGQMAFTWQHVLALMKRGTVAAAIVAAVKGLAQSLGWLVLSPVGIPINLLLAALLARRWAVRRAAATPAEADLAPPRRRLRAAYLKAIAALRRIDAELPPQPTPRGMALWVRTRCPDLPCPALAETFERYEVLRYSARVPDEDEVGALETGFVAGLRQFRKALPRGQRQAAANAARGFRTTGA